VTCRVDFSGATELVPQLAAHCFEVTENRLFLHATACVVERSRVGAGLHHDHARGGRVETGKSGSVILDAASAIAAQAKSA